MNVEIGRDRLLDGLNLVGKLASDAKWYGGLRHASFPYDNVLIECVENGESDYDLRLTYTDFSSSRVIEYLFGIKGILGRTSVSFDKLKRIVEVLPDGDVNLDVRDGNLLIRSGKTSFSLSTFDTDAFYSEFTDGSKLFIKVGNKIVYLVGRTKVFRIGSSKLLDLFSKSSYAITKRYLGGYQSGLYFLWDGNYLEVVSTDGHRLSWQKVLVDRFDSDEHDFCLATESIKTLVRVVQWKERSLGDFAITVYDDKDYVFFMLEGSIVVLRKLDTDSLKKLDYRYFVENIPENRVIVRLNDFSDAIRRASAIIERETTPVVLNLSGQKIKISSSVDGVGEAKDEIAVSSEAGDFTIGFNPKYLLDAVSVMGDEKLVIAVKDESSPCVFMEEKGADGHDYKAVVMPMRV